MANPPGNDEPQWQHQQQLNQQLYLQSNTHQIDVRMKRHPELQPYVPSDRDRFRPSLKPKSANSSSVNDAKITSSSTTTSSSSSKTKKCVSMNRLDQLAKPRKVFTRATAQMTSTVPHSSLSSSNATSTTASSSNATTTSSLTSTKNFAEKPSSQSLTSSNSKQIKIKVEKELEELARQKEEKGRRAKQLEIEKEEEEKRIKAEEKFKEALKREEEERIRQERIEKEDEEKRLKEEEELRELKRQEEEERQNRLQLVASILSKFKDQEQTPREEAIE